MNRRDYAAHVALRDTCRMDRGLRYAPLVPLHKPRKVSPLRRLLRAVAGLFV